MLATDKSYAADEDYQLNNNLQLLTYVTDMPDSLQKFMKSHHYILSYSQTIKQKYFSNHCFYCDSLQGDNFLHEVPEQAFYKKLFYKNSDPITYAKLLNQYGVPLQAKLPEYDKVDSSLKLILAHMQTGQENRASLMVTQKKINQLFSCSIQGKNIAVLGL